MSITHAPFEGGPSHQHADGRDVTGGREPHTPRCTQGRSCYRILLFLSFLDPNRLFQEAKNLISLLPPSHATGELLRTSGEAALQGSAKGPRRRVSRWTAKWLRPAVSRQVFRAAARAVRPRDVCFMPPPAPTPCIRHESSTKSDTRDALGNTFRWSRGADVSSRRQTCPSSEPPSSLPQSVERRRERPGVQTPRGDTGGGG